MSNINPIKFGVAGNQYFKQDANEDLTQKQAEKKAEETPQKQVSANDVLSFMAAQGAAYVQPAAPKSVNVSELLAKYVTPEQEARIAESMKAFETNFNTTVAVAMDEFGVEEKFAGDIALATINATM